MLLLSVLLSVCAVGVVGCQSWLLVVVAVGEMVGAVGTVGVDGGGWEEGLLIVCPLLMTTNRVLGFADARFGCSEEITTLIEFILLPSNGCIVQRKECSFG